MTATSCATHWCNGSCEPTRPIRRKAAQISSRSASAHAMSRPSNYLVRNRQRKHSIDAARVRRFLSEITVHLGRPVSPLSVVFISDEAMRVYNRDYRGFDKPTDVLSFSGDDEYLGDIL